MVLTGFFARQRASSNTSTPPPPRSVPPPPPMQDETYGSPPAPPPMPMGRSPAAAAMLAAGRAVSFGQVDEVYMRLIRLVSRGLRRMHRLGLRHHRGLCLCPDRRRMMRHRRPCRPDETMSVSCFFPLRVPDTHRSSVFRDLWPRPCHQPRWPCLLHLQRVLLQCLPAHSAPHHETRLLPRPHWHPLRDLCRMLPLRRLSCRPRRCTTVVMNS